MKHWQFYLAILLLVVLLLPRYEGMSSYPFELSPAQKKIQQKLKESPTEKEILEIEDEIISMMSPIQMKKVPEIRKENYRALYKISNLSIEEIHQMTSKEIESLNEPHVDALLRRIAKLNSELTSEQISGLSETRLKYMGLI